MKFRPYLIYISAAMLLVMIFISTCGKKKESKEHVITVINLYDSEFVKARYGLWVNESTVCRNVVDRRPIDPAGEFHTEDVSKPLKVFLFTRMGCDKPFQTVYHRYSRQRESVDQGKKVWEEVHTSTLSIKHTNFRTWTYKTVLPGKWRVDILAPDRKSIIRAHFFTVTGPEKGAASTDQVIDPDYDMGNLKLVDSAVCRGIENNEPIEPTIEFLLGKEEQYTKVWVWMKFDCNKFPTRVFLRWSKRTKSITGEEGMLLEGIYDLDIKGKIWRTKGVKTCSKGRWRLDILGPDRKTVLKTFNFEVKGTEETENTES